MSSQPEGYESILEEVAWQALRRLKRRISEAVNVASGHAPLVAPDVYAITMLTLVEAVDELAQKLPGKDERSLFEDVRAEFVRIKQLVDALVAGGTIAVFELAERRRRGTSEGAGAKG
jgi:hypothetical protein